MISRMISEQKEENLLRIASYNILNGGEERLDKISTVIKKINPDICGILEAVGSQDKLKGVANDLGYKFFDIAIANSKYNIAVLSKIPFTIKAIKTGIRHVILEATIENGLFKNFGIFFVHLSPISEDDRLLETRELLQNVAKFSEAIIMGDFNSLSPNDPYDQKELLQIFKKNNIIKYGTEKLRFDVIKKIESEGLVDTMNYLKHPFASTTPTPSNKDPNHSANIRIDYAFLTKNIIKYFKKAEVFKNEVADMASDHYPLFIELQK